MHASAAGNWCSNIGMPVNQVYNQMWTCILRKLMFLRYINVIISKVYLRTQQKEATTWQEINIRGIYYTCIFVT